MTVPAHTFRIGSRILVCLIGFYAVMHGVFIANQNERGEYTRAIITAIDRVETIVIQGSPSYTQKIAYVQCNLLDDGPEESTIPVNTVVAEWGHFDDDESPTKLIGNKVWIVETERGWVPIANEVLGSVMLVMIGSIFLAVNASSVHGETDASLLWRGGWVDLVIGLVIIILCIVPILFNLRYADLPVLLFINNLAPITGSVIVIVSITGIINSRRKAANEKKACAVV